MKLRDLLDESLVQAIKNTVLGVPNSKPGNLGYHKSMIKYMNQELVDAEGGAFGHFQAAIEAHQKAVDALEAKAQNAAELVAAAEKTTSGSWLRSKKEPKKAEPEVTTKSKFGTL